MCILYFFLFFIFYLSTIIGRSAEVWEELPAKMDQLLEA